MRWPSRETINAGYWGYTVAMFVVVFVLGFGQKYMGDGESIFYLFAGLLLGSTLKRIW